MTIFQAVTEPLFWDTMFRYVGPVVAFWVAAIIFNW